jgi:hypothetical protein
VPQALQLGPGAAAGGDARGGAGARRRVLQRLRALRIDVALEAARIAACLPNPIRFSVANPSGYIVKRTQAIKRQMSGLGGKKYLYKID